MFAEPVLAASAVVLDTSTPEAAPVILLALIPVIVPGMIAVTKFYLPKVPKVALPILAPILGALIEILSHYATGLPVNGLTGAVLGAAAVWVRETYDQIRKALAPPAALSLPATTNN